MPANGKLPKGWRLMTLGECLTESRIPGSTGKTARKLTVRLYGRGMVLKQENRPGSSNTQFYRRTAGQLVYSKLDFLNGAIAIVPPSLDGYETSQDLPAFDISDSVDARWLLSYLTQSWFYQNCKHAARGGRRAKRVYESDFLKLSLATPPRHIQTAIADTLDSVSAAIEATRAVIEQTRRLKSALLQELLTKGLPGRHKKFRLDRDFGRIPADWRVESLQSIAVPGSICYGVVQPGDEARDGIPLIRVCDIESAEINIPNLKRISPEIASNYRRSELKGGELLISLVGTIGRCTIAPPESKGFNIARAIAKVELKKTVNARFVLHVLNSAANQKLTGGAFQSARSTLNLAELAKIRVLQPEPGEQNRIAEVIDTIDGQEKIETDRLQQLLTFKSALSQGLLTGRIPVKGGH